MCNNTIKLEDLKTNKKKEITADLIKKVANNYRNFFGKKITDNYVSNIINLIFKNLLRKILRRFSFNKSIKQTINFIH